MNYLRGGCGVKRMEGENNDSGYRRFGMSSRGKGMSCGMVEMVKHTTLRWFEHFYLFIFLSALTPVGFKGGFLVGLAH